MGAGENCRAQPLRRVPKVSTSGGLCDFQRAVTLVISSGESGASRTELIEEEETQLTAGIANLFSFAHLNRSRRSCACGLTGSQRPAGVTDCCEDMERKGHRSLHGID